jgi:protein-disulfide isomerase
MRRPRAKDYVQLKCDHCKRKFELMQSEYRTRMKNNVSKKLYCSVECMGAARVNK